MVERDWTLEVTAYVDGELSADEARAFEAALQHDPALRALEQKLRRTIVAVEALPQLESPSVALRRQVLTAIDAQPRPWLERLGAWLTPGRLVPVGMAMAALVAGVVAWSPRGTDDQLTDADQLLVAQNIDVVEDLDLVGADSAEDLEVIASLHELEVQR
jgi:anti-sigma factor RsiW